MPLSGTGLKDAIKSAMLADGREFTPEMDDAWEVIASAIVNYIITNATVSTIVAGTDSTGGAVTGTGTGTPPATGIK